MWGKMLLICCYTGLHILSAEIDYHTFPLHLKEVMGSAHPLITQQTSHNI
jgi:hypothetical protein